MPPSRLYCSVYGCLNDNYTDPSLTFFSLPRDSERREQWLKLADRPDLLEKKEDLKRQSHLICSVHFKDSDIKIIKQLTKDAVPTINLPSQAEEGSSSLASNRGKRIKLSNEIIKEEIPSNSNASTSVEIKGNNIIFETKKIKKEISCDSNTSVQTKHEDKLFNNSELVNVGTQTVVYSSEKETQTSKDYGISRNRRLLNELRKGDLKRRMLAQQVMRLRNKIKENSVLISNVMRS